jgi:hypothetical protein
MAWYLKTGIVGKSGNLKSGKREIGKAEIRGQMAPALLPLKVES